MSEPTALTAHKPSTTTASAAPIAYSLATAAQVMDCSEMTIRRAIAAGHIKARKIGRKTVVLAASLHGWAEDLPGVSYRSAAPDA